MKGVSKLWFEFLGPELESKSIQNLSYISDEAYGQNKKHENKPRIKLNLYIWKRLCQNFRLNILTKP